MKFYIVLTMLIVSSIALIGPAYAQEATTASPGNFGIRFGIGTDISGGIAYGGMINYILRQQQNAVEMGAAFFGGSFEEDSEEGIHTYNETTDVVVFGALVNYLFRWSLDLSGPYFVTGIGFGAVSVEWEETSPTDTSLGPPLPGGGSSQSEEGTVGGLILNFGIGHRFNEMFDLRAMVPVLFVSGGDEREGSVVPMIAATAGLTF